MVLQKPMTPIYIGHNIISLSCHEQVSLSGLKPN